MGRKLSDIDSKVLSFAREHPQILSVSRGVDPEEGGRVYYLRVSGEYDFSLDDPINDFSISIWQAHKFFPDLLQWPVDDEQVFFGEMIYRKAVYLSKKI